MRAPLRVTAAAAVPSVRATRVDETFYPSSDGKPMAENMWQAKAIVAASGDLESARPDALVAEDILVYPEEGNRDNKIAPDMLVAFGLATHFRTSYYVWAEGKPPDWVLEVASPSTEAEHRGYKRRRYAEIGVPEYWMFDAKGGVYPPGTPRLQGLKLVDGAYRPLDSVLAGGERMIRSEVLGLDVRAQGALLRFRDVATGKDVRHRSEIEEDEARASARAERAGARAQRAGARAEREAARANREADARFAAEDRIRELEAALRRSTAGPSL